MNNILFILATNIELCAILDSHYALYICIIFNYKKLKKHRNGFYLGDGYYAIKYAPKRTETLTFRVTSHIPGFKEQNGIFVVDNIWPGKPRSTNYKLGQNWYTDMSDRELFDDIWQGGKTVLKWRSDVLLDWAKRWDWIR